MAMVEWRACLLWSFGNGSIILSSFRGITVFTGELRRMVIVRMSMEKDVHREGCRLRKMSGRLKEERKNLIRDFSKLDSNCEKFANGKQF